MGEVVCGGRYGVQWAVVKKRKKNGYERDEWEG